MHLQHEYHLKGKLKYAARGIQQGGNFTNTIHPGRERDESRTSKNVIKQSLRGIRLHCPLETHEARPRWWLARQHVVPIRSRQLRQWRPPRVDRAELLEPKHELRRDELQLQRREALPLAYRRPCNPAQCTREH